MHNSILTQSTQSPFDSIRRFDENGNEYWLARDLMPLLGYVRWDRVPDVIERASVSCQNSGNLVSDHFSEETRKTNGRPQQDFRLSRLACYLVAMNGDPRKPEIASAQSYFAIKTREAETTVAQPEVKRVLPTHTAVEYANAASEVNKLKEGILKQLLYDALVDELSLAQNLKYLPVAEKPKQYTIVKVRAKALGYSETQIGDGSQLGRFVKAKVQPAFQEIIGRYPVYHYEVGPEIDQAIHQFFS